MGAKSGFRLILGSVCGDGSDTEFLPQSNLRRKSPRSCRPKRSGGLCFLVFSIWHFEFAISKSGDENRCDGLMSMYSTLSPRPAGMLVETNLQIDRRFKRAAVDDLQVWSRACRSLFRAFFRVTHYRSRAGVSFLSGNSLLYLPFTARLVTRQRSVIHWRLGTIKRAKEKSARLRQREARPRPTSASVAQRFWPIGPASPLRRARGIAPRANQTTPPRRLLLARELRGGAPLERVRCKWDA